MVRGKRVSTMIETERFVAIMMGSDSDLPTMREAVEVLACFGIKAEITIKSAHRTPEEVRLYVRDAEARGCATFIAGAGLAAHLAGAVAAHTLRPVIGVPVDGGPLHGMDALLSTVQMPVGIPVACVAIGKSGARNAGYLAAQILAVSDPELMARLRAERRSIADQILAKDAALRVS